MAATIWLCPDLARSAAAFIAPISRLRPMNSVSRGPPRVAAGAQRGGRERMKRENKGPAIT